MNDEEAERLRRAAAADKRAGASPYRQEERASAATKLWLTAVYIFYGIAGSWMYRHGAPWWMQFAWWAIVGTGLFLILVFGPLARKIKRRSMLMAREQVHRIRAIDSSDPVGIGLVHLFDADPGLDRLSAEAGMRFALAYVRTVLDEVEATTPVPSLFGVKFNDDGKVQK